jgi:hypothetical protein
MEYWLTLNPWPGLLCWTLIYLSDYWLTIKVARMYRASPHFEFEGSLELTPQFEKDVDALKPVSRRHIIMLVITNLILLVFWGLFALLSYTPGFAFVLGMLILMEVGVHLRHLRSYFMLVQNRSKGGLEGKLYYRRWFVFGNSAFEFFSLAILFLFTALMAYSLFFAGGGLACLSLAYNHYKHYRRLYKQASAIPVGETARE